MSDMLKGKAAIVTGAGRGLGRAFALALAEAGASILVNDLGTARDGTGNGSQPADDVVTEIKAAGGNAAANYDSVATTEGGENIIKSCVEAFGKVDILVNNAGFLRDRMVYNMTPEEWDGVIKVHLYGTFNCTRPAAKLMREQRYGRIVNIISPTLLNPIPGQANYAAAKGGIMGFTRVISRDLGRYGVTANAFCPIAATRMMLSPEMEEASKKRSGATRGTGEPSSPAMQIPEPEDNAAIVVFLASDAAANINGQTFSCTGSQISLYTPAPTIVSSIHKDGRWTFDELLTIMPKTLTRGMVNPAPPKTE